MGSTVAIACFNNILSLLDNIYGLKDCKTKSGLSDPNVKLKDDFAEYAHFCQLCSA